MIQLSTPSQYNNKQYRIFSDPKKSEIGIRASDSRWSWLGSSIKYQGTDHKDYFINRKSAKSYLKRHEIKTSHLSDSEILTKLAELNPVKKEKKIEEQKSLEILTPPEKKKFNAQIAIGEKHLANKEYHKAFAAFKPAARGGEKGNTVAQYHLGNHYLYGVGVGHDFGQAVHYLLYAANKGHVEAQNQLGNIYALIGNNKDAFKYYSLSAEQGNADAQNNLGNFYKNGWVVKEDNKKAFEYYKLAADKNQPNAQWNIAYMYEHGKGVTKDLKKAFNYYELNSKTPERHYQVFRKLGNLYELGQGVKKDHEKAFKFYKLAIEKNDFNALKNMSSLYEQGLIPEKDLKIGEELHDKFLSIKKGGVSMIFIDEMSIDSTPCSHWANSRNLRSGLVESDGILSTRLQ